MNLRQGQDAAGGRSPGAGSSSFRWGPHVQHVTRRTVTETDNVLFTTMTMNPAPMHLDAEYAARSEFGRPLVNSMFTAALVVGLSVRRAHPGHDHRAGRPLRRPVPCAGLRRGHHPGGDGGGGGAPVPVPVSVPGLVVFEHRAFNQRDELVCRAAGTDRYLVPERVHDGPRWPEVLRGLLIPRA